jgi:hypothetical protein
MNPSFRASGIFLWVIASALAASLPGCDDRSKVPAEIEERVKRQQQEVQNEQASPPRPTTQELVSGSYQRIRLETVPLTMSVPQSWKIEHLGNIALLQGPTPFGSARIQFARRDPVNQPTLDVLYNSAKKDQAAADPQAQMSVELRDEHGMKVMERRSVGRKVSIPITDATGIQKLDQHAQPMEQVVTPMKWRLNLFILMPGLTDQFAQYELNFIDLNLDQYQADKAFLEKILYCVEADAGAAAVTAPAPAPATEPSR